MQTSGNIILITGGRSGIGRALAERWHDRGNVVIVGGRDRGKLSKTVSGRPGMVACELDIDSADAVAASAKRLMAD